MLIPDAGETFEQALTYDPRADVYRAFTRQPTRSVEFISLDFVVSNAGAEI